MNGVATNYNVTDGAIRSLTKGSTTVKFSYNGDSVVSMTYNGTEYWYIRNAQNDIIGLIDRTGAVVVQYAYDTWGKQLFVTGTLASTVGTINPFRYRGYVYDDESGLYYLQSRYYNPEWCRFINADSQLNQNEGFTGMNTFQYCGNNPVNRVDTTGHAWYHWAIGAAIVAACAVAVVVTAGGAAAAIGAVAAVASGGVAATTASTVAAAAFIGSAMVLGTAAYTAASSSRSVKQFNSQGNWGTVAATAGGAVTGGIGGYYSSRSVSGKNTGASAKSTTTKAPAKTIKVITHFNDDQNAVIQLSKQNRKGISMSNANILEGWGKEYGVRAEIHMGHLNRPSIVSQNPHFHFGQGSDHVPIFPE